MIAGLFFRCRYNWISNRSFISVFSWSLGYLCPSSTWHVPKKNWMNQRPIISTAKANWFARWSSAQWQEVSITKKTSELVEEIVRPTSLRDLCSFLHVNQRCVATLGEMIHTASLIHDDVVDSSDRRRGKPAAAVQWGPKKVNDWLISVFFLRKKKEQILFCCSLGSISWRLHPWYIIGVASAHWK